LNADWDLIERFERQLDPKQSEHDQEFIVKRKTPPRLYELVHIYGIKGVAAWFGSSFQHEGGFTPWEDVEKYVRYSDYQNHFSSPDVDWDMLDDYEKHREEFLKADKKEAPLKCPFMYYTGRNPDALKYIKFGEIVELLKIPEKFGGDHPINAVVKTSAGIHVVIDRCDLSTETPHSDDIAIMDNLDRRMKAASGDKDAISRLRGKPINPNSLFNSEEERQEFIRKFGPNCGPSKTLIGSSSFDNEPEYQNHAAAHFVTIADFIESGRYRVTRSECVQPEETENRFILTVEIVESLGSDRE